MPFLFTSLCDLFSELEKYQARDPPLLRSDLDKSNHICVTTWFNRHQTRIHDKDTDGVALLSALFPERRVDRVFRLKEPSLVRIIGRCLLLGAGRKEDLDRWKTRGGGDLGQCVERVMRQAENEKCRPVTVEQVDDALDRIASRCRFSGPEVREGPAAQDVDEELGPIFRNLQSRDAKWLTRMILKDYSPLIVPQILMLRNFHFLLPDLLRFQDSFKAALEMLQVSSISEFPPRPAREHEYLLRLCVAEKLAPRVGVKVGRPPYYKARSIKHCHKMAGNRCMSLARKYDGEYCQIHVDLSKGFDCIQIFSKSGKDSTLDRVKIHETIKKSLRIGEAGCKISKHCILEGELVVWSDKDKAILEFDKIRKHVSRSGVFLGTENDSP